MKPVDHTYFSDSCVHILSSSHNDIAFLDSPLATILFRNRNIIEQAILRMEEDPNFYHSMECTLYIKDFLILHPEMKERLGRVLANGQFGCGATFTQCYETSLTSEAMIRQYYLGKRWMKRMFDQVDLKTVWNVDVPARAMQSAQVMQKSGVTYLFISRMDAGFYHWYSPDGSRVSGYSTGHYHHNSLNQILNLSYEVYEQHDVSDTGPKVQGNIEEGRKTLETYLDKVASFYNQKQIPPLLAFLSIRDYDFPLNLSHYLSELKKGTKLPTFCYSSTEQFMQQAYSTLDQEEHFNHYRGERPNLWVYHQSTHAKAFWYNRNGLYHLERAERSAALVFMLGESYPQIEIDRAWEELLYLDHGWGGFNGHITDETYLQTSKRGYERARTIYGETLKKISSLLSVPEKGSYLTLFNPTFTTKVDVVDLIVDWRSLGSVFFTIYDAHGFEIPYQIIEEPEPYHVRILFTATLPSLGYTRLSLKPALRRRKHENPAMVEERENSITVENKFYSLIIEKGGITSMVDKQSTEQLVPKSSPLSLFEIFVLNSHGNGSGEFSEIQQAQQVFGIEQDKYWLGSGYTESASKQNIHWRIRRNEGLNQPDGPVATIVEAEARFPHFVLMQKITIYHTVKKVAVSVDIEAWDGTMYKEIRMHVPYQAQNASIAYAVPLGMVRIGKDEVDKAVGTKMFADDGKTVFYPTDCRNIHPREVQSWIAVSNDETTMMLGCPDTPSFDYDEKTGSVQPILLASRHSCLATGNPYHQRGDHHYNFSFTSSDADLKHSIRAIEDNQHPIGCVASYQIEKKEGLALSAEGLHIAGEARICGFKKAEDTDELVIRAYEMFGECTELSVSLMQGIKLVRKTDMLEFGGEQKKADQICDTLSPYAIETYGVVPKCSILVSE